MQVQRRVFYSFYFKHDVWRAATVRRIGDVAGNPQESDSRWEVVQKGGDSATRAWIDEQMLGMACLVVLIGRATAQRRWVVYEISKAWELGKGVLGIYVHHLLDASGEQSPKGASPFAGIIIDGVDLATAIDTYDPPYSTSDAAYEYISTRLASWVEEAIDSRASMEPH
jgi:hypothetical protein